MEGKSWPSVFRILSLALLFGSEADMKLQLVPQVVVLRELLET